MAQYSVVVHVSPLPGVLDPSAAAVMRALPALGFEGVTNAQMGKVITFDVESADQESARDEVEKMCEQLLANPVIEVFTIDIAPALEQVNA
ncbi:MAG TPA: phosphoribosylformylglycinamidine synthase subunit PurS [Acidimicrobiia bacterium]|nr:phosphoribosylformylglycinamidine synthase subunit PurS [Acidimicrobiia bacterium]